MITRAPYIFIASMDVVPDREELFNQVYDQEHVPNLARVGGVLGVGRYQRIDLTMSIGGQLRHVSPSQPTYHAVYALESPDVLASDSWAEAVEMGRWPDAVRPFTTNREHLLMKRLGSEEVG
jgi:hypothetical protein